jgi:hypothetical protein
MCKELLDIKLVKLYSDGLAYIPKFTTHQHINPRETASSLPVPDASPTRAPRVNSRIDAQGGREGKGMEGKGREGKSLEWRKGRKGKGKIREGKGKRRKGKEGREGT